MRYVEVMKGHHYYFYPGEGKRIRTYAFHVQATPRPFARRIFSGGWEDFIVLHICQTRDEVGNSIPVECQRILPTTALKPFEPMLVLMFCLGYLFSLSAIVLL